MKGQQVAAAVWKQLLDDGAFCDAIIWNNSPTLLYGRRHKRNSYLGKNEEDGIWWNGCGFWKLDNTAQLDDGTHF